MADNTIPSTDPALLLRAKQAYAKLDPQTKQGLQAAGITEQQWEQGAVVRFAADAQALNGGLHFDAAALAHDQLEPLDDVTPEEEAGAGAIAAAQHAIDPMQPAAGDRAALGKAHDALKQLDALRHAGKLPDAIYQGYAAQVAALDQAMALRPPMTQDQKDQAMLVEVYRDVFDRVPDPGGAQYWGQKIKEMRAGGMSDAAIKAKLEKDGRVSPEYQMAHGGGSAPSTSQAGQVPYINQYGDSISNNGSNCGPTSMAMIARAFGYGKGLSNGQLIAELGRVGGTTGAGTGWAGIQAMAAKMGKPCASHAPSAAWIKQQLEQGKLVCGNGDYYALPPHGGGTGGHYVAIVGLDKHGNFLVADPADRSISPRAYTAAQIEHFLKANGNGGQVFAVG